MNKTNSNTNKFKSLFLNDKFILLLIIINSITIFIEGFSEYGENLYFYIGLIDSVITLGFAIEAIVKIRHYGWKTYISSGWNRLDFGLVVISLPSIVLLLIDPHIHGISFLLVIRVLRIFKFLRFFKFVPGIDQLVRGIQHALKTSVFVLFGFFIFNFMIAVLSSHLFKTISPEFFGNPLNAMYTIFRIFTIEGWYEIPDTMVINQGPFSSYFIKGYFIIILILGGIMGLSLVNSIFVDSMVMDNNDALERKVDELNVKIELLLKNQQQQCSNDNPIPPE
jgi:voltage-gated sodium channel